MNLLKEISKEEAHVLNKEHGVSFGCYGISHTYTKHKKYYLCESSKNMQALNKVRSRMISKRQEFK